MWMMEAFWVTLAREWNSGQEVLGRSFEAEEGEFLAPTSAPFTSWGFGGSRPLLVMGVVMVSSMSNVVLWTFLLRFTVIFSTTTASTTIN